MSDPTIGQIAKLTGCHIETVRYYQRKGLIEEPPRPAAGGYRRYPPETVQQILFILRAKKLGFTLAEIQELLQTNGREACEEANEFALGKLDELEQKIEDLHWMRRKLKSIVGQCDHSCQKGGCTIITTLQDSSTDF